MRGRGRRVVAVVLSLALGAVGAACGDDDDGGDGAAASSDSTLTITETDYAFEVSGEPSAGTLTIDVTNEGDELHELAMAKLRDGKTVDDAREALEAASPEDEDVLAEVALPDSGIDDLGGIQLPGTSYQITGSGMEAGEYVLLCFLPGPDDKPHFSMGMITGFTIAEGESSEPPEPDVTFTATDDGLDGPDAVDAGRTAIEIVNDSSVTREVLLLKISDGKTIDDVMAWFESAGEGPPDPATAPVDFFAYVFDAEQDRTMTVDLTAGEWAIGIQDPEKPFDGPPTEDPHVVFFEAA